MNKINALRRQLESKLEAQRILAAERALSSVSIDEDLKKIDEVEKLLQSTPRSNKTMIIAAALVGAACLAIASVLFLVRLPTARLQINIRTESVAMRLNE